MNLKAKVERDEKVPIKKVNNRTHFFERVHKTKEVRQQKSTKSIKHQKSSKSNEVKPTKKFKNAKELINLKEVKNTKEVKTHILVFLLFQYIFPLETLEKGHAHEGKEYLNDNSNYDYDDVISNTETL